MSRTDNDQTLLENNAKETHKQMVVFVITVNLFCVFFNIVTLLKLKLTFIIIYISLIECFFTIHFFQNTGNKKEKLVNIIESLLFNGNLLIIFIYTDEFSIHLISFSSLQILCQIVVLFIALFNIKKKEQNSNIISYSQIRQMIAAIIKFFFSFQIFLIQLKLSNLIKWSWTYVFSLFWVFQSLILLFSICLIIDLIKKICEKQADSQDIDQQIIILKGGKWLTFMMTGISLLPLGSISSCFIKLGHFQNLYNIINFSFCILFIITEIIFYKQNYNYLNKYFVYSELQQFQNKQQQITQSLNNSLQGIKNNHPKKFSIEEFPQILYRVSSTYYKQIATHHRNFKSVHIPQFKFENYIKTSSFDEASLQKLERKDPIQQIEQKDFQGYNISSRGRTEMTEREIFQQNAWMLEGKNENFINFKTSTESMCTCLSCYDKQSTIVNMPCGHGGLCQECSDKLLEINKTCYLCRKKVQYIAKLQESNKKNDGAVQVFNIYQMN